MGVPAIEPLLWVQVAQQLARLEYRSVLTMPCMIPCILKPAKLQREPLIEYEGTMKARNTTERAAQEMR
jgi:hypothetical protein